MKSHKKSNVRIPAWMKIFWKIFTCSMAVLSVLFFLYNVGCVAVEIWEPLTTVVKEVFAATANIWWLVLGASAGVALIVAMLVVAAANRPARKTSDKAAQKGEKPKFALRAGRGQFSAPRKRDPEHNKAS